MTKRFKIGEEYKAWYFLDEVHTRRACKSAGREIPKKSMDVLCIDRTKNTVTFAIPPYEGATESIDADDPLVVRYLEPTRIKTVEITNYKGTEKAFVPAEPTPLPTYHGWGSWYKSLKIYAR